MVGIRTVAALVGIACCGLANAASADPVTPTTFAHVSVGGLTWSNPGTGISTLNTSTAGGDIVDFSFYGAAAAATGLTGPLQALEQINGGAGATSTAMATDTTLSPGLDLLTQTINSPTTISYSLINPIGGLSDLLTITITPNSPGSGGALAIGVATGSGGNIQASYPPSTTYTETFTSDFLDFPITSNVITANYALSALSPALTIGSDGQLSSFTADAVGTFSSSLTPLAVPEPASFAVLAAGLIGVGFATRRRHSAAA
jgi:hypothetical protein